MWFLNQTEEVKNHRDGKRMAGGLEQLSLSCSHSHLLSAMCGGRQLSLSCLSKLRKLDAFMFSRNDDGAAQAELPRSSSA